MRIQQVARQLQEPQFAYPSNAHGALQDKVRNKFGKQCTWNIRGDAFDQLRRNLCDEVFGRACQTVLVADAIIHAGRISNRTLLKLPVRSSVQSCARNRTITKPIDDVFFTYAPMASGISFRFIESARFEIFPEMLQPIAFVADRVFLRHLRR